MSKIWFECKVKYRKVDDNGVQKVVTEAYLVDAVSFTEAESRINEEMKAYISEEFRVTNIRVTNYSEVVFEDASDYWFKAKISLIAYDEDSGKEKKQNMYTLVQANTVDEAYERVKDSMKTSMGDYTIPAVSETNLVEVFPYIAKDI